MNEYKVIDEFKIKNCVVVVLDREYDAWGSNTLVMDDKEYDYELNSVREWIVIKTKDSFLNKKIKFVKK